MTTMNGGTTERQEIEALLPWHAAGTLNRRDAERVERALAGDCELARHYDVVREELTETIHLNESLGAPSARAMEKLFAAIDAESSRAPRRRSTDVVSRFAQFLAGLAPRTLVWTATAAALAIMVQAAVLTTLTVNQAPTGTYKVAGIETEGHVKVRFSPQASAQDINNFLEAWKATLVDGPKNGGLFTLHFANDVKKEELVGIVKRMQTQTKVVEFVVSEGI